MFELLQRNSGFRVNREIRRDIFGDSRQPREIGAILLDLARRQTNSRSLTFAGAVVGELGRAVPLLEKPFKPETVVRTVRQVLATPGQTT